MNLYKKTKKLSKEEKNTIEYYNRMWMREYNKIANLLCPKNISFNLNELCQIYNFLLNLLDNSVKN